MVSDAPFKLDLCQDTITTISSNNIRIRTLHKSELPVMKQPDSEVISLHSISGHCRTDLCLARSLKWITSKSPSKIPQGSSTFIHLETTFLVVQHISTHYIFAWNFPCSLASIEWAVDSVILFIGKVLLVDKILKMPNSCWAIAPLLLNLSWHLLVICQSLTIYALPL